MQELVEKLKELIGQCEARLLKFNKEDAELTALRKNLDEQKEAQDKKEKFLKEEDEKWNERKNIVQTVEEALEQKRQNSLERDRLKGQREHFELEKKGNNKDIKLQWKLIGEEHKRIQKLEKTYEKRVLKEIARNSK